MAMLRFVSPRPFAWTANTNIRRSTGNAGGASLAFLDLVCQPGQRLEQASIAVVVVVANGFEPRIHGLAWLKVAFQLAEELRAIVAPFKDRAVALLVVADRDV